MTMMVIMKSKSLSVHFFHFQKIALKSKLPNPDLFHLHIQKR